MTGIQRLLLPTLKSLLHLSDSGMERLINRLPRLLSEPHFHTRRRLWRFQGFQRFREPWLSHQPGIPRRQFLT
jgi:hypothetical protein